MPFVQTATEQSVKSRTSHSHPLMTMMSSQSLPPHVIAQLRCEAAPLAQVCIQDDAHVTGQCCQHVMQTAPQSQLQP